MKRRPGLVINNTPHTIKSGGNLLVNCRWERWKKLTFFYLKIIIEFQGMFNWIAKYCQAQNNDNDNDNDNDDNNDDNNDNDNDDNNDDNNDNNNNDIYV